MISNGKTCSKCHEYKDYREFCKDKQKTDGHSSVCRECKKKHYQANKDRYAKQSKEYRKTKRGKEAIFRRREKQYTTSKGAKYVPFNRSDILERFNWTCQICKCRVHDDDVNNGYKAHIDHIIPLSKGGSGELSNTQLLCQRCNLQKYNKRVISL